MALERMTGPAGLNQINPSGGKVGGASPLDKIARGPQGTEAPSGLEFKRALEQVSSGGVAKNGALQNPQSVSGAKAAGAALGVTQNLKFSNHAIERMHSRGISFGPDEMKGIENAVMKAAQKGAKDTLVLTGDNALIVSVKNSTVVTVMDRAAMKDNVFTNIDSTVVL